MELSATGPSGTEAWFDLTEHSGGQPIVPVSFDDVEVLACWDTGAGLTAVDAQFARNYPHLFEPVRAAIGVDSSGVEMETHIARMTSCQIAGIVFASSACAIVDFGPLNAALVQRALDENRAFQPVSFVLGMPVIAKADWTFDFPARRWTLTQLPPQARSPTMFDGLYRSRSHWRPISS
jgi:hypothetical protein